VKPDSDSSSPDNLQNHPAVESEAAIPSADDVTIALPNPSRSLPAATMGHGSAANAGATTGAETLGTEDATIAISTHKQPTIQPTLPGAATVHSHGGLPAATAASLTSMGKPKTKSHVEALTGNDGWIGDRYRLLDKLGEGGFGLVYRAEQVKPLHRLVAIKLLKAGVTSADILGRFAIEKQTLAIMEHPNISKVLDAGETEMGAPFFVMELVKGRSITTYCKQNDYDVRQRLSLLIPVCQAVHHAHQKGIIHRDLKPGNILVTDEGGKAVPKVIDFGIAKVLEGEGSGHTIATGVDQLVGTPGYISPEQIEHGSAHMDTRSDVYALGAILFELLCGKALVTPSDLAQKPIHILLRELAERDAPKPSSVDPAVQGDLDWITLKALERDPDRRYGSASDLADDITRYLKFEPVVARPPSRSYMIARFVRRHRVGVAASAAIALAVTAGGITSTALYFKAERNRIEAEQGREGLRRAFSRSDTQMARQHMDSNRPNEAVAYLTRSLRTDPKNDLAATNLLSLLANVHLIRQDTPLLSLPETVRGAAKVAVSPQTHTVLAVSRVAAVKADDPPREVVSTWDMKTGERVDHPVPPGVQITCLEVTPDGASAVLGRDDGVVELWSLKDGRRRNLQPRMPNLVTCVAFSGNGEKLLAGSEIDPANMGTVQAWDLRRPQEPARVMRQKGVVAEIVVDQEGIFATSVYGGDPINAKGADGVATTWDLRLGTPAGDPIEVEKGLLHAAIEPKEGIVALGMNNGLVFVGNFRNGGEVLPPLPHSSSVTSLAFSADGKSIVVGDGGGFVYHWDVATGKLIFPPRHLEGEILKAVPAADSSLVVSVSRQGEVSIFDSKTQALQGAQLKYTLDDATVSRDGSLLAIAPRGVQAVQVWDIHERMSGRRFVDVLDKNLITRIKGPDNSPEQLRNSEVGGTNRQKSLYAAASPGGEVFIYDAKTLKPIGEPFKHPPAVGAVTLSMDGKYLITSGRDREVRVWDIPAHKNTISLRHDSWVSVLALSPDDQHLVTITDEGEVRVWNFRTGDCLTPGIRDTPRDSAEQEGIVVARVSDDGKTLLFRVSGLGFFSVPMPPHGSELPEWFLQLAEGLARRRLTPDGRTENLTREDFEKAVAAIPEKALKEKGTAARWARWLLSIAKERALSPMEDEPFDEYLRSLKGRGVSAALSEYRRYRPQE